MRLFYDATNPLRWGPHVPTGIARVEGALAAVLEKHRDLIQPFSFDPTLKRCRLLTGDERAFLEVAVNGPAHFSGCSARSVPWWRRIRETFGIYKLNPFLVSSETHRSIAQYISASTNRHGSWYSFHKLIVRLVFYCWKSWSFFSQRQKFREFEDPLASATAGCLLSINTCLTMYRKYRNKALQARTFLLIYDTIPLDHPSVVSTSHAVHFKEAFIFSISHSADIISISEATRQSCLAWCARLGIAVNQRRFHVVAVASPLATMGGQSIPLAELTGRRFVVYCSTIEPRKNHQLLLGVWSRLVRTHGADKTPMLVLVGKWAWPRNPIEGLLAGDPALSAVVRIFSYLPDEQLTWLYQNAAFSVFPSISEGWGLGATESLDFGTPVIISDIPALREAVQGLMPMVPASDALKWEETITRLILDADELRRLRQDIRQRYVRRSPDDVFRDIAAIMTADDAPTSQIVNCKDQ